MNGIKDILKIGGSEAFSHFLHLFLSSLPSTFAERGSRKDPGVGTGRVGAGL